MITEDKISMIKELRTRAGCGLGEAKEAVEEYIAGGEKGDLMAIVAVKVENAPSSTEYAQNLIRRTVRGIVGQMEELQTICEDDFGFEDLHGMREIIASLSNDILRLSETTIPHMEELLYNNDK